MKYDLKYSPEARDRLREIKEQLVASYGKPAASIIMSKLMKSIRGLQDNPKKGPSVEELLGIPTPYRFLHVEQNYAFYRIEQKTILVANIFNEREDFMWRMFRVNLRSGDSVEYWGE